jgi:hypothetical protein
MAEKIIGSLLYDDHPIPKKSRAMKERLKVPVGIALVLIVVGGAAYKFANFREERRVRQFIEQIRGGQYDAAYKDWDATPQYTMKDFLEDWGQEGYYTKGMQEARVATSSGKGSWVICVCGNRYDEVPRRSPGQQRHSPVVFRAVMLAALLLVLAATTVDLDVVSLPLSNEVRVPLAPSGRADLKREGTVTRLEIEIDRIAASSALGPALNTYVVWAISPEGILDNVGELDINGVKGRLKATSRLSQFGILITAEPHYMVDRPGAVAYRSLAPPSDFRKRTVAVTVGTYDYSTLKPPAVAPGAGLHGSIIQARAAFAIAQSAGADQLAAEEFRNAQVAIGSMGELLTRNAPLDILWPTANEAIRWSQRATTVARERR